MYFVSSSVFSFLFCIGAGVCVFSLLHSIVRMYDRNQYSKLYCRFVFLLIIHVPSLLLQIKVTEISSCFLGVVLKERLNCNKGILMHKIMSRKAPHLYPYSKIFLKPITIFKSSLVYLALFFETHTMTLLDYHPALKHLNHVTCTSYIMH